MFSDDFWGFLGIGLLGVSAYQMGKEKGVKKTVEQYEAQAVIQQQQQQIALLTKKIDELKEGQDRWIK